MKHRLPPILIAIALSACVPAAPDDGTPTAPTRVETEAGPVTILPLAGEPAQVSLERTRDDRCGAESLQALLGQPESVFFRYSFPDDTRFIGPDDAVTQDFRARRLNFDIGANGRITRIWCG